MSAAVPMKPRDTAAGFRLRNYHIRFQSNLQPDIRFPHAGGTNWTPAQIFQAYNGQKVSGSVPQTIGVVELGGGYKPSDIRTAMTTWGLPQPTLIDVSVGGATNSPGGDADGEVALDIELAAALYSLKTGLPATIRVYFAANTDQAFLAAFKQMIADDCSTGSCSWGAREDNWTQSIMQAFDVTFAQAMALLIWFFSASGDNDSGDGGPGVGVDFPASSPHGIGCGGTTKSKLREIVWNNGNGEGTGGGYSAFFKNQAWQVGSPANQNRLVPDIAANADPQTGYPVYLNGQWQVIGGTSAVAPIYAGLFAGLKGHLKAQGRTPPANLLTWLYQHPAAWTDITVGNNGQWRAGAGLDPCTGLGVLNDTALTTALMGGTAPPPPANPTATLAANPTTIPPGGQATLDWSSTGGVSATLNGNSVPLVGAMAVSPTVTTTYTLIVFGAPGSGQQVAKTATVTVGTTPPPTNWTVTLTGSGAPPTITQSPDNEDEMSDAAFEALLTPAMRGHLGPWRRTIRQEMVAQGVAESDADEMVSTRKLGDGTLLKLILQYGPAIYAIVAAILKMFGGPSLPPLPPIPTPPPATGS